LGCISAMTGWPGSGATKTSLAIVVAHTDLPRMNSGVTLADCGGLGRPEGGLGGHHVGGDLVGGGASPRGLPGSGCFRSAGSVAATLIRQCMQVLPKIWGITPPASQAACSDSKCAAALIRQCMHMLRQRGGSPPGAPVHSHSGAVAVAWRSWSLRTSSTRAPCPASASTFFGRFPNSRCRPFHVRDFPSVHLGDTLRQQTRTLP
jgi:hypothetical protein